MYGPREVSRVVVEVRRELGLSDLVQPEILHVRYDGEDGTMLIVAADRPDKAAVLGPGGRVLKRVGDILGVKSVAARSQTYLLVKQFRVNLAISAAKRVLKYANPTVRGILESRIIPMLENELKYPERSWFRAEELPEHGIVIAFSGGVDSTAALLISKLAGLNPIAVTVDAGSWMVPPEVKRIIGRIVDVLGVRHEYLKPESEVFGEILGDAVEGRRHPCKRCHSEIEKMVVESAENLGIPFVGFGDLLPTGNYSIYHIKDSLVRFNVAAALSLSKTDTILAARGVGHPGSKFLYGCPLLRVLHRRHNSFRYISINRVLRELRAQILEPSQALKYVKSILS